MSRLTEKNTASADGIDRTKWLQYARSLGTPAPDRGALLPEFLVVSPAKTGTSWLFEHLRYHQQILVPPEKEVRYFDRGWRTHDIDWYCAQFSRHQGRLAGDISPTYALLPAFAIKLISALKPDLKIVLLLREPAARAWSHLKHTFRFREANFAGCDGDFSELSLEDLICNLVDDFTLSSGDYESIVVRWSAHFPREQMHIAFFEDAVAAPERYFTSLLGFLGAKPPISPERRPLHEVIFQGMQFDVPIALQPWLLRLYQPRRRRIERLLLERFGMTAPWPATPEPEGPVRLPGLFDGWVIELHDGEFHARRRGVDMLRRIGVPSRFFEQRRAGFIGDLADSFAPHIACEEAPLRRAGFSREDCRLTRVLDTAPALPPEAG
jgi:hypothetical protein